MRTGHAAAAVAVVAAMLVAQGSLDAQELTLKRELPTPPAQAPCEGTAHLEHPGNQGSSSQGDDPRVRAHLDEASRATVLGELSRAREILTQAVALASDTPEIHFELGRVASALGDVEGAVAAFCQVVALSSEGSDGAEAAAEIERLAPRLRDPIPPAARQAFQEGVARFDANDPDAAAAAFTRALTELPDWPDALFNRGVAHVAGGLVESGRRDLAVFLSLDPDTVGRSEVIAFLSSAASSPGRPNPAFAFTTGMLLPGGGQMYAGSPSTGVAYLLAAAGSASVGLFYTRTTIRCGVAPDPTGCPEDQVLDRATSRPLLAPGLATGALITLIGAVRAYRHAAGSASSGAAVVMGPESHRIRITLDPAPDAGAGAVRAQVAIEF